MIERWSERLKPLPRRRDHKIPPPRRGKAIHAGIALGCNDSSDGNRVQFDYFVVRLRIGFGGTNEIDVIADRFERSPRDSVPIHIRSDWNMKKIR